VADAFAPRVEQANRDRAAAHLPGLDEAAALALANEVTSRLSGDEQVSTDRTRMGFLDPVEQLHDLELCERDAHPGERFRESRAQDPVHPSLGVDEPTCSRRLTFHRDVIPRDADTPAPT
jgi:hypothetical protein